MTTSRTNTRRSRRIAAGLALATVASTFGAGLAPGVSSANEFEPKPTAEIAVSCVGSPHLEVTLGNVHGLAIADFVVQVDDPATFTFVTDNQSIATGASETFSYPLYEGEDFAAYVGSGNVSDLALLTGIVDCSPPLHATIAPECSLYEELLIYRFDNTEQVPHQVDFHYPAGAQVPDAHVTVAAGQSFEDWVQTAEDTPIGAGEATITVDGALLASFEGTPDCVNPQASIELVCPVDGDPEVIYHLSNDGPTYIGIATFLDGALLDNDSIKSGTKTVTATVAEDAPFAAEAVTSDQVTIATLSGVADCDQPDVPEIPDVPETTIPVAVPAPVQVQVQVLSSEVAAPATAVAVSPHFTG